MLFRSRFGLVLGTRRFAAIVGAEKAGRILETSATFGAADALAMGFLHRIAEQNDWPQAVATASQAAAALAPASRAALYRVLSQADDEADMAELVSSASRPGLKDRIAHYLAAG